MARVRGEGADYRKVPRELQPGDTRQVVVPVEKLPSAERMKYPRSVHSVSMSYRMASELGVKL